MKNLISAKELSCRLGISRAKLSRLKAQIGFYQIGVKTMFSEEDVERYLIRVEQKPAQPININNQGGPIK